MKSLTRYPKQRVWLPTWLTAPLGTLANRWTAATAPYDDEYYGPDNPMPYELHVLKHAGRVGLGLAGLSVIFGMLDLWFSGPSVPQFLAMLRDLASVGIASGAGIAVYVVSRVHRRRFANIAIVLLLAWLAVAASPLWHFGWKIPVAIAVPALLALLSYWKELDP